MKLFKIENKDEINNINHDFHILKSLNSAQQTPINIVEIYSHQGIIQIFKNYMKKIFESIDSTIDIVKEKFLQKNINEDEKIRISKTSDECKEIIREKQNAIDNEALSNLVYKQTTQSEIIQSLEDKFKELYKRTTKNEQTITTCKTFLTGLEQEIGIVKNMSQKETHTTQNLSQNNINTIYALHNIKYDNKILNYQGLIKPLLATNSLRVLNIGCYDA